MEECNTFMETNELYKYNINEIVAILLTAIIYGHYNWLGLFFASLMWKIAWSL